MIDAGGEPGAVVRPSPRRWGRFIVSGGVAFLVDAGVLALLTRVFGLDALLARVFAILCAMLVSWQMHRRVTFRVAGPPTLSEFARFAAVAWSASLVNYLVFAAILLVWPQVPPLSALVVSSLVAALFTYTGLRLGVFTR